MDCKCMEGQCMNSQQQLILNRHLKRIDPEYEEVIFSLRSVLLYIFDKEWVEIDVEGPLYLYRTKGEACSRLIVFNRNGQNDFKLDISGKFYLEEQEQFVIFNQNSKEPIIGFWIDNEESSKRFYKLLSSL
ncbi:hypothetical protein GINT2_000750 [Glugoides intestinalis]